MSLLFCWRNATPRLHMPLHCGASATRSNAFSKFQKEIELMVSPPVICQAITHGITDWTKSSSHCTTISVHSRSVKSVKQLRNKSQYIGWDHLLHGRHSLHWRSAYCSLKGIDSIKGSITWGKLFILSVWKCATTLWKKRNPYIYGVDDTDAKQKTRERLQAQVHEAYASHDADPFYVSPQHTSLFEKCTLDEQWNQSNVMAWLSSVHEGRRQQEIFRDMQTKNTHYFYPPLTTKKLSWGTPLNLLKSQKKMLSCPFFPLSLLLSLRKLHACLDIHLRHLFCWIVISLLRLKMMQSWPVIP